MRESKFPDDLVYRCGLASARAVLRNPDATDGEVVAIGVIAILRESGHAELVSALKEARRRAQAMFDNFADEDSPPDPLIIQTDEAFKKAGVTCP